MTICLEFSTRLRINRNITGSLFFVKRKVVNSQLDLKLFAFNLKILVIPLADISMGEPLYIQQHVTNFCRILTVRLPCKKIYPLGPIYLMAVLKRAAPQSSHRLLDLALIKANQRMAVLEQTIRRLRPDVIAFSWRDIQVFSPNDMDQAMRDAYIFFYDGSPLRKMLAAFKGLGHILTYRSAISENMALIRKALSIFPGSLIAAGGPSIKIFEKRFRQRIPSEIYLHVDSHLDSFFEWLGLPVPENPVEPELDLKMLERAFPEWGAYREESIGIQTKHGCPHDCLYCLYGYLEGKEVIRRNPDDVVKEIKEYCERWGSRKFWFADAQLLSGPADHEHLSRILEGLLNQGLGISWSGYLRINKLDPKLAGLMVRTGLHDLEVSLNSGSQIVLDQLRMGFSAEEVIKGCEVLQKAGYSGRVFINLSFNAPGETRETLMETVQVVRRIQTIFGDDRVFPVIFFLAIQPHTGLEQRALEDGHISDGYDPLSVYPWDVRKLVYNPAPLDQLIGRCCAQAFRRRDDYTGRRALAFLEKELRN